MTRRKKAVLITVVCLLLAVVLAGSGALILRPDWRYRLSLRLRIYPDIDLTAVSSEELFFNGTAESLLADERTVQTNDLLTVSGTAKLPTDYSVRLEEYEGFLMERSTLEAYRKLEAAVLERTDGDLMITSTYRTPEEQQELLEKYGPERAANPGESEHETGMALDVCQKWYGGNSFLKTEAGRFVGEHCRDFGFIIRYPLGKESVTGHSYEPWHIRYVGAPHAALMSDSGLTMEEYLETLTPDTYYQTEGYLIFRSQKTEIPIPKDFLSCVASPDNLGYTVYTFQITE